MRTKIYIHNVTLDDVLELREHATDAHDPLVFFSFDWARTPTKALYRDGRGNTPVAASKNGAHASHYVQELQDRLWELGLIEAKVSVRRDLEPRHAGDS